MKQLEGGGQAAGFRAALEKVKKGCVKDVDVALVGDKEENFRLKVRSFHLEPLLVVLDLADVSLLLFAAPRHSLVGVPGTSSGDVALRDAVVPSPAALGPTLSKSTAGMGPR